MRYDKPERITTSHVYFWGSVFSNWYPSPFIYKNIKFFNSEAALMYEKASTFNDLSSMAKIINTVDHDPRKVKAIGRKVSPYDDNVWSDVRYQLMIEILLQKFTQIPEMLDILLETGDRVIVEGSPYDVIWGVGLHWNDDLILKESNWKGDNLLGKALMEVRSLKRIGER